MQKISNGAVNEEQVAAVLQRGPNWEIVLASGQGITISEADAKAVLGALGVKDDPPKKTA
jgi:hypothetical protein